jgi:hypothetical protein
MRIYSKLVDIKILMYATHEAPKKKKFYTMMGGEGGFEPLFS